MDIVLGGTGRVGSSVAAALLEKGRRITVVTRSPEKAEEWRARGAETAVVDVSETEELHKLFRTGRQLFILNPPADPATDTVAEERRTAASILKALKNSAIEKVVAQSTYGAQPGEGLGDLGVLYEMEEGVQKLDPQAVLVRGAYFMSNWDGALETAGKEGVVHTFYPVDFKLPMAAPKDIGEIAAGFLMQTKQRSGIHYVEGPETYSSADVAAAFSDALKKEVKAVQIPADAWVKTLKGFGFSDKAAHSMAAMTEITLKEAYEKPASPIRGETTLRQYIDGLVSGKKERT